MNREAYWHLEQNDSAACKAAAYSHTPNLGHVTCPKCAQTSWYHTLIARQEADAQTVARYLGREAAYPTLENVGLRSADNTLYMEWPVVEMFARAIRAKGDA